MHYKEAIAATAAAKAGERATWFARSFPRETPTSLSFFFLSPRLAKEKERERERDLVYEGKKKRRKKEGERKEQPTTNAKAPSGASFLLSSCFFFFFFFYSKVGCRKRLCLLTCLLACLLAISVGSPFFLGKDQSCLVRTYVQYMRIKKPANYVVTYVRTVHIA